MSMQELEKFQARNFCSPMCLYLCLFMCTYMYINELNWNWIECLQVLDLHLDSWWMICAGILGSGKVSTAFCRELQTMVWMGKPASVEQGAGL